MIIKHLSPEVGALKIESFDTRDARRVHFAMRAAGLAPCARVKMNPDVARDRFLSPEEVSRLELALVKAETVGSP